MVFKEIFLFFLFLVGLSFGLILFFINFLLSGILNYSSSFECGFNNSGNINTRYSLNFFLVLIIFVVFDMEIVLLFGFLYFQGFSFFTFIFIMLFIFMTYYLEVSMGKICWLI